VKNAQDNICKLKADHAAMEETYEPLSSYSVLKSGWLIDWLIDIITRGSVHLRNTFAARIGYREHCLKGSVRQLVPKSSVKAEHIESALACIVSFNT
jgi:hypothetical protein